VGRSTTIASTWFCFSAVTTSFESLKTFGSFDGWTASLTASRLVVPIWTPISASFRSASELTVRSEPLPVTTACGAT
jgi:hypothetical protein